MNRYKLLVVGIFLELALISNPATSAEDVKYLLHGDGGRLDWSDKTQMLCLDRLGPDGFSRIWIMDGEGQNSQCLTCNKSTLPYKHHGNPAWHPSGKYIVFQAVDPKLGGPLSKTSLHKLFTSPGAGVQNNIWITTQNGNRAWHHRKDKSVFSMRHQEINGKRKQSA